MRQLVTLLFNLTAVTLSILSLTTILYHVIYYWKGKRRNDQISIKFNEKPEITILIPIKNEPVEIVNRVLKSLLKQTYPKEKMQIIIISDDSEEKFKKIEKKILREEKLKIELYRRKKPKGFKAGAINHAISKSRGEYIVILDADAVLEEEYLEKAIGYMDNKRDVDIVATCWQPLNPKETPISEAQSISLNYLTNVFFKSRREGAGPIIAPGSGCIIRRKLLEELGGLDEKCLAEDVELSIRTILSGRKVDFFEDAKIYVENPEKYYVFKRQQARWIYGTNQVLIKYLGRILTAKIPLSWKLGLIMHLTQYQALLINIAIAIISATSLILGEDLVAINNYYMPIFIIALGAMAYSYYDAATQAGLTPKKSIINMGRSTAIISSLTPTVIIQDIKAIFRIGERWYITPKGKKKSGKKICLTEIVIGTVGILLAIILFFNRYMASASSIFTMSLPYLYVGIKTLMGKW